MAIRVPWDEAETALLIDAYLKIEADQLPMQEAVAVLSRQLRHRAKRAGIRIDEVFRDENGIRTRLGEIQFLMTGGKLGFRNTSSLFKEMVNVMQSDPESFNRIRYDAQKEIESTGPSKEGFFKWLSNRMTGIQFAEMRFALADLNDYAKRKNLIRVALLETYDLTALYQIKTTIQADWWSRTFHKEKHTRMAEACSLYLEYLQLIRQLDGEETRHQHNSARRVDDNKKETTEKLTHVSKGNLLKESLSLQSFETSSQDKLGKKTESSIVRRTEIKTAPNNKFEPAIVVQPNSDTIVDSEHFFVSLSEKGSYSFTTPLYLIYFGKRFDLNTWTEVYRQLLTCLHEDYKLQILQLAQSSRQAKGKIWLGFGSQRTMMTRPIQFAEDMYAEVNLGANAIIRRIANLLQLCSVDMSQVEIAYKKDRKKTKADSSSHAQDALETDRAVHETEFKAWLLKKDFTMNTVNSYLSTLRTIERAAMKAALVSQSLLNAGNMDEALDLQNAILNDLNFARRNRHLLIRFKVVLRHFMEYLTETISLRHFQDEKRKSSQSVPDQTIQREKEEYGHTIQGGEDNIHRSVYGVQVTESNELYNKLRQMNVSFVDNRQSGGNLWVIGDQNLLPTMIELRKLGLHFRYRSEGGRATRGKPAWWTRDYLADEVLTKHEQQEKEQPKDITEGLPIRVPHTIVESPSVDTTHPTARPVADDPLLQMLAEHFPLGFRLESVIDLRRFRTQWRSKYGVELGLDDKSLQFRLQDLGVAHNGLIYHLDRMLSLEKRQQLLDVIHHWITHEQRVPIFYNALYTAISDLLRDEGITSPEMLKSCLVAINPGYFRLEEEFLSIGNLENDNFVPKVANFMLDQGKPMKLDEVHKRMPHLTQDVIRNVLKSQNDIISSGSNEYFHLAIIDVSKEEVDELRRITQQEIDENHYISGSELVALLREKLPHIMAPYAHISETGLRKALGIWLGDRFSFNGNLVSTLGKELTIYEIYVHFCRKRKSFTLQDLYGLRDSIGPNPSVYFDAVYDNALRVSEEQFVSKDMARFDVDGTDAAIDLFCSGEYAPIRAITSFSAFPDAGYLWNEFLLEHYVYAYSLRYRLVHGGFRSGHATGAIVKKDAPFQELHEVLTHDLAHSGIALQRDNALDYFVKKGYIARMRLTGVENILSAANKIRNMRG